MKPKHINYTLLAVTILRNPDETRGPVETTIVGDEKENSSTRITHISDHSLHVRLFPVKAVPAGVALEG